MPHQHTLRVYYEDTDMAGIVYYANYLKFIERGRSEWVREIGVDQNSLKDEHGLVFAVRRLEAEYLAPARLEDVLVVHTDLAALRGARFEMKQEVKRGAQTLFAARVMIAVMSVEGRPARLPRDIRDLMRAPG